MKILAFDQASQVSGYAMFTMSKPDNICLREYGSLDLSKEKDSNKRVKGMMASLCKMVDDQSPDFVTIEDVSMQKNPNTLIMLSRIQGAVIGHCYAKNIPLMILKPTEWRKVCGIKQGRVKREVLKQEAMDFIKLAYKVETIDDNEADAVCIGHATAMILADDMAKNNKEENNNG